MAPVDRSAPGVRVSALPHETAESGTRLDLAGRILSFTYEDCEDKTDKLTLELDNFDLAMFERVELLGGSILEVSWGYPGEMAPPRRAVIKSVKGFQTIKIEAHALAMLMHQEVKSRRWEGKTRGDVVREVAREHGYEGTFVDIEDTTVTFDVINQTGETDARFLKRLAAREGFEFFVDATGLHWHRRRQNAPPTHVFTWYSDTRGEVLSVNVESDLVKRVGSVTVKGRDALAKSSFASMATADTAKRSTTGEVIENIHEATGASTLGVRNLTASVASTSAASKALADREAEARFVKAEREAVKLTLQVVGDPTLAAKTVVEVRGISPMLSGKYYVKEAKHSISGSGYVCDLQLTRDGKSRLPGGEGKPQTGDKNTASPAEPGKLKEIEAIDKATGASSVTYKHDGAPSGDPEAHYPKKGP